MQINSFIPIANRNSTILILGTMPGNDSLKYAQYYAHPRNVFWKLLFEIYNTKYAAEYNLKKQLLQNNHIALWDVLEGCFRQSSLDSDITEEKPNDIEVFLEKYPNIKHIVFNGKAAQQYFKKYFKHISVSSIVMPSTSPANAIPYAKKLAEWKNICNLL
jgi:hypoxanthine-DNA glycosylase